MRIGLVWAVAFGCASAASAQSGYTEPADPWTEATLYRDEWGVPHVFADNPRAMAFAFGYAQAEDHLEPMLIAYRLANGRAAEVAGEEFAEADRLAIRLDHAGMALDAYSAADSITRDLCEGFALGVNTWMTDHLDRTPEWAEGVQPADVLALFHRYLMSQAPFDYPEAHHMLPSTPSANAWAVGPAMSQSGDAMLVINPHAHYDSAYQWYEAHLVTNDLNVYGATLFGLPVIVQGHNAELGWALAPNFADTADLYVETAPELVAPRPNPKSVMPQRQPQRRTGINYSEVDQRPHYIWTPQGFVEETVDRYATWRGPIVANAEGRSLSWRVGGYEDFGAIRQLYDMALARDLDAFRRVLDRQQLSPFHALYADRTGNIFYQYTARTGIRPDVRSDTGTFVFAGGFPEARDVFVRPLSTHDGLYDWRDSLPPDAMPWLLNPDSGYVQACGTPPWFVTSPTVLDAANFPSWLARDVDTYRAKRVRRLFSLGPRSFEDMQAMLFDSVSPLAAEAVPFLLNTARDYPEFVAQAHPDLRVGLDMLAEWNYLADPGSLAMTYFHVWWTILRKDESGAPRPSEIMHSLLLEGAPWFRERALRAAADAAMLLRDEFQSLNVPWGEVHVIQRGDRVEPIGGAESGEPIFATGDRLFDDGRWYASGGYGFAMVVRFGDWPEAVSLVPFGSSEVAGSRHFDDQLDLLLDRRFKRTRFHRDDIERHAESVTGRRLLLRPAQQDGTVYLSADETFRARLGEAWTAPVALPTGLAAFSAFVEPAVERIPAGFTLEVELAVSPDVCAAENLESLYLWGYSPAEGWRELPDQTIDVDRSVLTGAADRPQLLAALGPARFLLQDPSVAAIVDPSPPPAPPRALLAHAAPEAEPGELPEPGGVTRVARNDDASVTTLSQSDTARISRLDAPAPPVLVPHDPNTPEVLNQGHSRIVGFLDQPDRQPSNIRSGNFPFALPAVPPGFVPDTRDRVPPGAQGTATRPFTPIDAQGGAAPLPEFRHAEPPVSQGEPIESPSLPVEDLPETATAAVPSTGPETGEASDVPAAPPASTESTSTTPIPTGNRVSFSDKTPREMMAQAGITQQSFELAPDPGRASPLAIGTQLELRTPDGSALFTVRTKGQVRGQAWLSDVPPAPIPAGLALRSPIYIVRAEPATVPANTAIAIHAPAGLSPEAFAQLKLYVYDPAEGWIPLPGHRADAQAATFGGIDFGARTYALLGPAND